MPELRLVTVTDDGTALVLGGDAGQTFTLPITDALRAAVRGDRARLGQLEIALESQLTPKEIQTRIRHGESAEEVARAAGVPVERIRRFEGPVLGEREHVASQARRSALRRGDAVQRSAAPALVLEEVVLARLAVEADAVGWDAWRREDGRWTVQATYRVGAAQKRARFAYDVTSRMSVPDDDDARWLADERPPAPAAPPARVARLVPVESAPDPVPADGPSVGTGAFGAAALDAAARADDESPDDRDHDGGTREVPAAAADEVDLRDPVEASAADEPQARRRAAGGKARRAAVPSWDEIVFGRKRE